MQSEFIDREVVERGVVQWDYSKLRGIIDLNETLMIKNLVQSPETQTIALKAYGVEYCKIFLKLMVQLKYMEYTRLVISLIDNYIGILSTGFDPTFRRVSTF
jgi:hypothetical protein